MARLPFAPDLQRRDDAVAEAWQHYREQLDGISGRAYENAEESAWEDLQADLEEIERLYSPLGAL